MGPLEEVTDRRAGKVIVAFDGSPCSIVALRNGARISSALGLGLEAVTVWQRPDVSDEGHDGAPGPDVDAMQAAAVASVFGEVPPAGFERKVLEGAPITTLLTASEGAEMLVLGSRGRGGFAGLLLGSVSAACAANASCAVLVCHADAVSDPQRGATPAHDGVASTGAAGGRSRRTDVRSQVDGVDSFGEAPTLRRPTPSPVGGPGSESTMGEEIVVGVDGTVASVGALRQGAHFAESMHLPLLAICASGSAELSASHAEAVLLSASRQVFGYTQPDWFRSSVRAGTPAAVLGQASAHARMLIIGHSVTGDSSTSQASVSSTIASGARCPIVIFHATKPLGRGALAAAVEKENAHDVPGLVAPALLV